MKLFFIILTLILSAITQFRENDEPIAIVVTSTLQVKGWSNVNSFCCSFQNVNSEDTLTLIYTQDQTSYSFNGLQLEIEIAKFDCGNRMMNKEFYDMLHMDQYPTLKIILKEISTRENCPLEAKTSDDVQLGSAKVEVVIAGIAQSYDLQFSLYQLPNETVVQTNLKFNIKDFGLTPPKKMFGLVRVKDFVEIEINCRIDRKPFPKKT